MLAFRRSGAFLRQKADIFECYYVRSSGIHEAKVAVVPGTGVFMCVGFHHNQRTRCSQLIPSSSATIILLSAKLEPVVGFEPTTDGLQNRSSTTELSWRQSEKGMSFVILWIKGRRRNAIRLPHRNCAYANGVGS